MSNMLPPLILELRAHAGQVKTELAGVDKEIDELEKKSGSMSGFQKGFNRTAMAGKYLAGGIAAAATVVGYESVKMAASFQQASLHLVTDAGESQKNLKMVQQGMLNLSAQTGISADEIAKGMYLVESAGFHGAAGLKVMQAAAEGAKIGGADLTTVSDALTTAMHDYHFPASQAALVTSKLIATVGQGKTTMEALAGSLHNVLPTANGLHMSFDQVAGAMATMTGEGVSADQASQNLAHAISSLASPTLVQTKEMAALGLNSTTVAQQLGKKGLTGTLNELVTAITSHMGGKAGPVLMSTFAHSQLAAQSASAEFKGLGKAAQNLANDYMRGSITSKQWTLGVKAMTPVQAGLAKQWANSYQASQAFNNSLSSNQGAKQTFVAALSKMTGGQQGLSVAMHLTGENMSYFENNVKIVGKATTEAGGHVKGWAETQKLLIVQLDQAKASIEKMGIQIGTALIPYVSKALKGAEAFIGFLSSHQGVLIALASVIGGIMSAAIAAWVIQMGVSTAKTIIWAVQQVASVSESLAIWSMYAVEWVAKQATSVAESTALWAMYAVEWIGKQAASIATSVALWAAYSVQWIAQQASSIGQSIALWSMYAAQWVAKQASAMAANISRWVAYGARWVAAQAVAFARWAAMQGAAFAQAAAKGAAYAAVTTVQALSAASKWAAASARTVAALTIQGAALVAQKAVMIASAIATGVVTAAQWAWNVAMDANPIGIIILAIAALIAIIILVATHWKQITAFLITAWQNISTVFQSVGRTIAGWWNDFWNSKIGGFVKAQFAPLVTWIGATFRMVVGFFQSAGGAIQSAWNAVWNGIGSVVRSVFGGVIAFIQGAVGTISNIIGGVVSGIKGITSVASSVGSAVKSVLPSFDVGGVIPGPLGAPVPILAHGGEVVLSHDMLAGRQPIPKQAQSAMTLQAAPGSPAMASAGSMWSAVPAPTAAPQQTVNVYAQTNATPQQIASAAGWELRRLG